MAGEHPMHRRLAVWLVPLILLGSAHAQFRQQGPKLVGIDISGNIEQWSQGLSVALSADGNTALIGSEQAEWVFVRNNCAWMQQAELPGASALLGGVALSADGNTALAATKVATVASVFVRVNGVWTQQGLLAAAALQNIASLALSADGNTAAIGIQPAGSGAAPQILVFVRNQGAWSQQGTAFAPSDYVYIPLAKQPIDTHVYNSLALSSDGNTLLFGVPADTGWTGATFVFTRANGQWTEQAKLAGSDAVGAAEQGNSVALSNDGNTALIGGPSDNDNHDGGTGATWVFTRSSGTWIQQGNKLVARDAAPGVSTLDGVSASQGWSVSLSADGNTAIVGGPDNNNYFGAAWIFIRNIPCPLCNGTWSQQGPRLFTLGAGGYGDISRGQAVAMSGDGNTALVGTSDYGPLGQLDVGSTFVFARGPSVFASAGNPQTASLAGFTPFPIEVTAVDGSGAYIPGATISFSGPASGPGLQTIPGPGATDATGVAAFIPQTNGTVGSYELQANSSIAGACSTGGGPVFAGGPAFSLSNLNPSTASGSCSVTSGADDNGPGTLRYQVAACGKGGTITFDPSVSLVTLSQGQDIQLQQDLTIDGGTNRVTIDAQDLSRIFFVFGGNITLKNLTLRNGTASGGAGGPGGKGGGGAAGMGGAVFVNGGALNAANVTFSFNNAFGGDGGFGTGSVPQVGGGGGVGSSGGVGGQFNGISQNGNAGGGGDFGSRGLTGGDGSGGDAARPSSGFGGGAAPVTSGSGVSGNGGFGGGGAAGALPGAFGGSGGGNDGGGGAGLGGAIFIRAGSLVLAGSSFTSNTADGGANGGGIIDGQGKGGALFINSGATALQFGSTLRGDSASDSGSATLCSAVLGSTAADTDEVCGTLATIGSVTATGGGGQITGVLSPFPMALVATVTDAAGNPISGVPITFSGPGSGASISSNSVSAVSDIHGNATVNVTANAATGSYTVTTSILGVPVGAQFSLTNRPAITDLAVTKTGAATGLGGGSITYTLKVTNNGPDTSQNVILSDTMPAGTVFASVTQSSGPAFTCTTPAVNAGGGINCTAAILAAGATATFSLVVQVYANFAGTITNTASVSTTSTDPNSANNGASFMTTISAPPPVATALGPVYTPGASYRITAPSTGLALGPVFTLGASYRIGLPSTPFALGPIYTPGASYRIGAPATGLALGPIYTSGASYRIGAPATPLALGPIYTQGASYRITAAVLVSPSQISTTSSGLAYSRVSQTYIGTITVRNISGAPIAGPIQILFTALPSGVTLANATGTFNLSQYLTVPNVTSLAPGQSAVVSVAFHNPSNLTITFTPVIYSGSF
jgi:uncharacterized repeat protein (TIGR01451 family)